MVMVFVRLVELKSRTIDEVPANLRVEVLAKLNERGFDGEGNPLVPSEEVL